MQYGYLPRFNRNFMKHILSTAIILLLSFAIFAQKVSAQNQLCDAKTKPYPAGIAIEVLDEKDNHIACNQDTTINTADQGKIQVIVYAVKETTPATVTYNFYAYYTKPSEPDKKIKQEKKDFIVKDTNLQTFYKKEGGFSGYNNGEKLHLEVSTGGKIIAQSVITFSDNAKIINTNETNNNNPSRSANFAGFNPDQQVGILENPLSSETVSGLIAQIIKILLILVGSSAVIVIAISGFQLVLGGGAPDKRATAIKSITWAIAGLILSLLSFSIVAILQRIIS